MSGYYLPACVVLAAAVIGTRRAYHAATELLPLARSFEAEKLQDFSSRQVADLEEKKPQRKTSSNPKGRPRQKETKKENI
jgi:hypothetical protein